VITTSHLLTDYKNTRIPLSEATHIVVFPSSGDNHGLNYVLKTYVGLSGKQIPMVKKLKSRWVCFRNKYPKLIITENQCFLLDELESEPTSIEQKKQPEKPKIALKSKTPPSRPTASVQYESESEVYDGQEEESDFSG
jgi:hypothetical protein